MRYLEKLVLDSEIKFGTEIEFKGVDLTSFFRAFPNLPLVMMQDHKTSKFTFEDWCLDSDSTVSTVETNVINKRFVNSISGGEISSKILSNKEHDWIELKQICSALRKFGAYTDDCCSNHVNVSTELIRDNLEFYKVLTKIVVVFENELIAFSCGESKEIRIGSHDYAREMRYELLRKIKKYKLYKELDFNAFLYILQEMDNSTFTSLDGINLQEVNRQGRIEFRYPNGTLNPTIIQNNINFFLKIVLAIINNRINIDYLNHKIEETNPQDVINSTFDLEKAEILSRWISLNEVDKKNFMWQFKRQKTL